MSFRRIVNTLASSITELAAVSFDDNNHYGDVFVRNNNTLGAIKPSRLRVLFPALNLLEESSSQDAEAAIHKAYQDYQDQWFWKRLWWYFTQPISTYKHLSMLITLRDLHAQYEKSLVLSKAQNGVINPSALFVAMVVGLTMHFNSLLSKSMGFWGALFQPKTIKDPIKQLRQLEKEVQVMLEKNAEQEYVRLLQMVHANEPNQDWQALEANINNWFNGCADRLGELINSLDGNSKSQYQNILDSLKYKQQFLLQAVTVQQEDVNQHPLVDLSEKQKNHINNEYEYLQNRLNNIEAGFTLQIHDDEPKHPNTYSVYQNMFNQWQLRYYQTTASSSENISLDEVAGLEEALENPLVQPDTIKDAIATYHNQHLTLNNTNHAAVTSAMVAKASPEVLANNLIGNYSFSLEKNCKNIQELDAETSKAQAVQLLQYCDYVHQKKEALKPVHQAIEDNAQVQLLNYNVVTYANDNSLQEQKMACIRDMAFGTKPIDDVMPLNALREQYENRKASEAFINLNLSAQLRIETQYKVQVKSLKRLIKAIKMIKSQDLTDSVKDFFYSMTDDSWKVQVDADFQRALEYILSHQPMLDEAVMHHLHEVSIACFYKLSCKLEWSKSDLRLIFQAIEQTKKTMLSHIQANTQTLVLLPPENQPEILPQPLLSEALTHLDKLPTTLGQLRLEFKLALRKPETDINKLLDYYQSLAHGLVCRIEAIVWDLIDDNNVDIEAQCAVAKKEIEAIYKSLALLCHPDKKSDANADNQMKLLVDIKEAAERRVDDLLKNVTDGKGPPELPIWIMDNRMGCYTSILKDEPSDSDKINSSTIILIICKNPGYEIGYKNKLTHAYEQRRLPVEHEAFIFPHATHPHLKRITDVDDQIKLKQIVAAWGGITTHAVDKRQMRCYDMGYLRFQKKWMLAREERINKEVDETIRMTQEVKKENQEMKRNIDEVNKRAEKLTELLFSLHPELKSSYLNKEIGRKTNQPNNTNHDYRFYSSSSSQSASSIGADGINNEGSEIMKKSVRVRSNQASYISSDVESSSDNNAYLQKMHM